MVTKRNTKLTQKQAQAQQVKQTVKVVVGEVKAKRKRRAPLKKKAESSSISISKFPPPAPQQIFVDRPQRPIVSEPLNLRQIEVEKQNKDMTAISGSYDSLKALLAKTKSEEINRQNYISELENKLRYQNKAFGALIEANKRRREMEDEKKSPVRQQEPTMEDEKTPVRQEEPTVNYKDLNTKKELIDYYQNMKRLLPKDYPESRLIGRRQLNKMNYTSNDVKNLIEQLIPEIEK
jgi:hypothetical protein